MKKLHFAVALIAVFALASSAQGQRAAGPSRAILAAVADPTRPAEDAARDGGRHPAEIVAFAGVRPGDRIVELAPGGGYYTRILARSVGPRGHVYAVVSPGFAARPESMAHFQRVVAGYPNVEIVVSDLRALTMARPVDLVWTSENYHDFHNAQGADLAAVNRAVFDDGETAGVWVNGKVVAPVSVGQWMKFAVTAPLASPTGTWSLQVTDGQGTTTTVNNLPYASAGWSSLNWWGFVSQATVATSFCLHSVQAVNVQN